ncbi:MAG: DUF3616 domain-containing protein [Kofleriaceae bacterium]
MTTVRWATLVVALVGCGGRRGGAPDDGGARSAPVARAVTVFEGMCDASGAVPLGGDLFVVANDEDNVLRVYDARRGGPPLSSTDISAQLDLPLWGGTAAPETDLEAATRLGDHGYWLTSHGRSKRGKPRPERMRFFATTLPADGVGLAVVGAPYELMLDAIVAAPSLAAFDLAAAATRAPKEPGGFNLEGMTATFDGRLLIGLRNPVPGGLALLFTLDNAAAVVERAAAPAIGPAIRLDLGGLGVRSLSAWRGRYLIVAGAIAGDGASRLYTWDGRGAPVPSPVSLAGFNPEGFFTPDHQDEIMLLSDDGDVDHGGVACKDLPDPAARSFRGMWVAL